MQIQLLRHATTVLKMKGQNILIDPMLSPRNEMDPVQNCGNEVRIPMEDLPLSENELAYILNETDAIFITHTHRDHWDIAAQNLINKSKLIFCQPNDELTIRGQGFKNVNVVNEQTLWKGISIHRTSGQHGTGEIGLKMGPVSGFVFDDGERKVYFAGDTIWCEEVQESMSRYKPDVVVVNAGGAQFQTGGPITMTPDDILQVHAALPMAKIISVHMDTVNHCFISRKDLIEFLKERNLEHIASIPLDGELIQLEKT